MSVLIELLGDPAFLITLGVAALVGGLGFFILREGFKRSPIRKLLAQADRPPRDPKIAASFAAKYFGISTWQSGVMGPVDKDPEIIPYAGLHVLEMDDHRAVLAAGADSIAARWALSAAVFFPVYAVVVFVQVNEIIRFFARGGRVCYRYAESSEGVTRTEVFLEASLGNFLRSEWCQFSRIFGEFSQYPTLMEKFSAYFYFERIVLVAVFVVPLLWLLLTLRRPPAPLVLDRARRLVWTQRRGRIWSARWPEVQVAAINLPFATAPAFALFEQLDNGATGRQRWFPTAAHHGWGEIGAWRVAALGLGWIHRWDGMRCWAAAYMENGPEHVHGRFEGIAFARIFAPRPGELDPDLSPQAAAPSLPDRKYAVERSMKAMLRGQPRIMLADECGLRDPSEQIA